MRNAFHLFFKWATLCNLNYVSYIKCVVSVFHLPNLSCSACHLETLQCFNLPHSSLTRTALPSWFIALFHLLQHVTLLPNLLILLLMSHTDWVLYSLIILQKLSPAISSLNTFPASHHWDPELSLHFPTDNQVCGIRHHSPRIVFIKLSLGQALR